MLFSTFLSILSITSAVSAITVPSLVPSTNSLSSILKLFTLLATVSAIPSFINQADAAVAAKRSVGSDIAMYWGQASAGSQESLEYYCQNTPGSIYIISFISSYGGANQLTMNIAGYNDFFAGTGLLNAPTLGDEIKVCQSLGKKVFVSLGGAAGSYGFTSDADAANVATELWNHLGGGSSDTRPFGDAKIDGFDLDAENTVDAATYSAFVNTLRELYATDASKSYYVSAAPQCPYPDASVGAALASSYFDFINIQFYNNYCSLTGSFFNMDTWQNYASTVSQNPNVALLVGLAGSSSAAGSGYISAADLSAKYSEFSSYPNFGGFMVWDASQANSNVVNGVSFAQSLQNMLSSGSGSGVTTTAAWEAPATSTTVWWEEPTTSTTVWWEEPTTSTAAAWEEPVTSTAAAWEEPATSTTVWWEAPTTSTTAWYEAPTTSVYEAPAPYEEAETTSTTAWYVAPTTTTAWNDEPAGNVVTTVATTIATAYYDPAPQEEVTTVETQTVAPVVTVAVGGNQVTQVVIGNQNVDKTLSAMKIASTESSSSATQDNTDATSAADATTQTTESTQVTDAATQTETQTTATESAQDTTSLPETTPTASVFTFTQSPEVYDDEPVVYVTQWATHRHYQTIKLC